MSIFDNGSSPTGRLTATQPAVQHLRTVSFDSPMTARQRELLQTAKTRGFVEIQGRQFTEQDLRRCFNGHQIPKDPAMCEALDLVRLSSADFSALERRILAHSQQAPV